jgi:hypothetical protein
MIPSIPVQLTKRIRDWFVEHFPHVSATALQITAVVLLHASTLPSLISVMMTWTDRMPMLDMVILVWAALIAMFAQAMLQNHRMMIGLISVGFMLQAIMMALIFFR